MGLEGPVNFMERHIDLQLESISLIHEMFQNEIGISSTILDLSKNVLDSCLNFMDKDQDKMSTLLKCLTQKNYLFEHSLMMSYIGLSLAKYMKWDSQATLFKIGLASLIHDAALLELQDSTLQNVVLNNCEGLNKKEQKVYDGHPQAMAEKIRSLKNLPPDIDTMVLSHHERPDGSGFPRKLNAMNTAPLSCILILSEAMADKIYTSKNIKVDLFNILNQMQTTFSTGNYKRPLAGLLELFA